MELVLLAEEQSSISSFFLILYLNMDEVDKIIIISLREIGCDIGEDFERLKQFTTEMVVEAASRCIEIIQPGSDLPSTLPPSMSARIQIGTNIAQCCTNLGYTGEVGYHTFLYSNEAELRKVLMFLIERLPKESENIVHEPTGKGARIRKQLSFILNQQLSSPWLPSFCRSGGIRWHPDGTFTKEGAGPEIRFLSTPLLTGNGPKGGTPQDWRDFCINNLPLVTEQINSSSQLIPSLITLNARGVHSSKSLKIDHQQLDEHLAKEMSRCSVASDESQRDVALDKSLNTRFNLCQKMQAVPVNPVHRKDTRQASPESAPRLDGAEQREKLQEEEEQKQLEELRSSTEELQARVEELQVEIKTLSARLPQVLAESQQAEKSFQEKQEQESVRRRIVDLLPDADTNVAKLQTLVESLSQKLVGLASQWEKRRLPLIEQYRQARKLNSSKASESARQAESLRVTRERAAELTAELRIKEELRSQLKAEYQKISKDISRSAYTRRIMEIIANIHKQKKEIEKVLGDTRELHKEINSLTGRLDRSFTVADELIFSDAKKDDTSRRAYKLLATLHSDCGEIVKMIEETGSSVRESRDLEDQIETEMAKNVRANLERISADLRQMKQETSTLTAQLKNKS